MQLQRWQQPHHCPHPLSLLSIGRGMQQMAVAANRRPLPLARRIRCTFDQANGRSHASTGPLCTVNSG